MSASPTSCWTCGNNFYQNWNSFFPFNVKKMVRVSLVTLVLQLQLYFSFWHIRLDRFSQNNQVGLSREVLPFKTLLWILEIFLINIRLWETLSFPFRAQSKPKKTKQCLSQIIWVVPYLANAYSLPSSAALFQWQSDNPSFRAGFVKDIHFQGRTFLMPSLAFICL